VDGAIADAIGRHAFVGLGFQERTDAFDFNVALQDFVKYFYTHLNILTKRHSKAPKVPVEPTGPKADYSLKQGQTFSINIGGVSGLGTCLIVPD
jgi:hypothetical protein